MSSGGTSTSIPFFLALFDDPEFLEGRYDTGFLSGGWIGDKLDPHEAAIDLAIVAAAITRFDQDTKRTNNSPSATDRGWKRSRGWKQYGGRS